MICGRRAATLHRNAPQAPTKAKPVVTPRPKKGADDDWRNTRLDARPASRSKKTEPAAKQASAQDAGGPSDADVLARKAENPELVVFVAADESCDAGALLQVLDRFAREGIGDVSLVGSPGDANP